MWFTRKKRNFPLPYKTYSAALVQSGTAAPVATKMFGDGIGTIVWTRTGAGTYRGTLAGTFTNNKTELSISNPVLPNGAGVITIKRISADVIEVVSSTVAADVNTNADGILGAAFPHVVNVTVYV